MLPENWTGGELCLDDWIRFNSKLWVDLFWPRQFDWQQPLLIVDDRWGQWIGGDWTTGYNQQGDAFEIQRFSGSDNVDLEELLSLGLIDLSQHQALANAGFVGGGCVCVLTNVESPWLSVVLHSIFISFFAVDGTQVNLIAPFKVWNNTPEEVGEDPVLCIVDKCNCAEWNLPALRPEYLDQYTNAVCARQARNADRVREIERRYRRCRGWATARRTACLMGVCFTVIPTNGWSCAAIPACEAWFLQDLEDCRRERADAYNALAAEFNAFVRMRCLEACIASANAP